MRRTPRNGSFYRELESGRVEHAGEPLILLLALVVLPVILLEEASAGWLRSAAFALNLVIWTGFAAELAFVLKVSRSRTRTLRAHWLDAAIVVLSVPLAPAVLQGTRALRLLRLLRVLRLAAFGGRALVAARALLTPSGFRYVALLVLLLVVVGGAALSFAESGHEADSLAEGIWLALVTVTTVGYGDVTPETPAGRVIAAAVMVIGIGFIALLTATVAATFVKRAEPEDLLDRLDAIDERLGRIEHELTDRRNGRGEPPPPG